MQLKDDLIRLLAVANILMQDRPFLAHVILALVRTKYPKDFDSRLQAEKEHVVAQLEVLGEASAKKIREAQGK